MYSTAKVLTRIAAFAVVAGLCLPALDAQTIRTQSTRRKTRVAVQDTSINPLVVEAESAIEKQDLAKAHDLLLRATAANPKDHRAWFVLGYVFAATERRDEAIDAYSRSVEAKPDVFESNMNLGKLLGSAGRMEESARYLRAATQLKPETKRDANLASAWMLLGAALRQSDPLDAARAFDRASKLDPKNVDAVLFKAQAEEAAKDYAAAEATYKTLLLVQPENVAALKGVADMLLAQNRLTEAEGAIRKVLQREPGNVAARFTLGRVLLKSGKPEEALPELEAAVQAKPDPELVRQVVELYIEARKFDQAAELLKKGIQASPKDARLRHQLGAILMRARNFKGAEAELITAVNLDPNLGEAYGDLAFVASENKNYPLALKALEFRSKLLPDNLGTIWLRATSYDHMRAPKEASKYYREFLATANGQFPDREWQARHRLIAIDPTYSEKKK